MQSKKQRRIRKTQLCVRNIIWFGIYWVCCNFEVALKQGGKNSTRFKKNTLTSWVLQNRVKLSAVSHVTDPVLKSQFPTNMNLCMVLLISYLLAQYGEMNYKKIDREVLSEGNEHESTTNNILWLFSILAHPDNRDLLVLVLGALQAGKAFNRAEINGPPPWKDQIFYTVLVQFSK